MPGSDVPAVLGGIPLSPWADAPTTPSGWEKLAAAMPLSEPAFQCPAGLAAAAGVLILEPDGRAWCVAPSNRFGGHEFTFPKGRPAPKGSLAAAALSEAFEETGLRVRLINFLCDAMRSVTYTRFFVAERLGGSPAAMHCESQSAVLAPIHELRRLLTHPGDQAVLDAYEATLL